MRALGELTAKTDRDRPGHRSAVVCLVTLSVATEAQVKGHMCWSSAFDPFEGSTLGSKSVPGGRTDRSREPSRARAVRRLGVPVGMGGKANCLCLRGIWETPKPRYREETKPVVKLPGTTFRAKDPACHARSWGARYRGTETAGPSAKRGDSLAPRGTSEFREVSRPRGACPVTFAVCAKCSSVLEPTGTRSPRS